MAQALYEQSTSGTMNYLDEAWHDDLVSVRKLQEAIAKARGVPPQGFGERLLARRHPQ